MNKLKIGHRYFPDERCRICQKNGIVKEGEYLNLNDFMGKRFLCTNCLNGQTFIIPLVAGVPSQFSLNIEINKGAPQQTKQLKEALTKIFKQEVQKKINELMNYVVSALLLWRSEFQAQLQGICGTFCAFTIHNFLELLANDPSNTKNILESVEALRFSGCRSLNKTDELVDSVIKSFRNITELLSEQLENTKQRYTLIRSKMSRFKIGKIYDHASGKPKVTNLNLHSLEKFITTSHISEVKNLEKGFYKKGLFDQGEQIQEETRKDPEPINNQQYKYERIMSSSDNKNETKNGSSQSSQVKIQAMDQNEKGAVLEIGIESQQSQKTSNSKASKFQVSSQVNNNRKNIENIKIQSNDNPRQIAGFGLKSETRENGIKINCAQKKSLVPQVQSIDDEEEQEQVVFCSSIKGQPRTQPNVSSRRTVTHPSYILNSSSRQPSRISYSRPFSYPVTEFGMESILYVDIYNYRTVWKATNIPYEKIKSLIVKFDKSSVAEPLKHIHQLINLEEIIIEEPNLCKLELIKFYITTFSKLRRLELNCYNEFNFDCIKCLEENLTGIEILHYGSNFHLAIKTINEKKNFREQPRKKPQLLINDNQVMYLIDACKNLKSLWIPIVKNEEVLQCTLQLQNLQFLTIGNFHEQQEIHFSMQAWQPLTKIRGLRSLAFLKLQLHPDSVCKMIKNAKGTLESLCIRECKKLVESITDVLGKNCASSMKEVEIFRSGEVSFEGRGIFQLCNLQVLILRSMDKINSLYAEHNIRRLNKLKHLDLCNFSINLDGSAWASDNFTNNGLIYLKPQLEFLGLCNTTISTQSTAAIKSLKKLTALNIGHSRINAQQVQEILHEFPGLKKLSLWGSYGDVIGRCIINTKKMIKLASFLKEITHLDVGGVAVEDKMFGDRIIFQDGKEEKRKLYPELKHVNLWMTKVSKTRRDQLRMIGINVLEGE